MTARSMTASAAQRSKVVTNEITKSLQIISDKKINVEHDPKTLK